MPGSHLGTATTFYRGREVKLPGERTFENWNISVINDTDFAIHDAFENWMNTINDVKTNVGITNPLAVSSTAIVEQLDRNGVTLKTYTLADAWPVDVSPIQLDFGDNDKLEQFQVQIAYSFWETTKTPSAISATIGVNTPIGGIGISL